MKDGQFIASFNHNNKVFEFRVFNNKLNCFCYDNNGNSFTNLDEDEKNIVISVAQSLLVDESRSHYIRDYKVGGEMYKIYLDPTTNNYFWKTPDGRNNPKDNVYLNLKYNDEPSVVYFKKNVNELTEQELDKEIKKLYPHFSGDLDNIFDSEERLHKKQVMVYDGRKARIKTIIKSSVVNALLLSTLPMVIYMSTYVQTNEKQQDINPPIIAIETQTTAEPIIAGEQKLEYEFEIPTTTSQSELKEYSWNVIKDAITNNPHLTNKEKEFLYELRFVFDENYQYMDLKRIVYRLENLKIVYNDGHCPDNSAIAGRYFWDERNQMEIFKAENFDDVNINVFLHEFLHVLQSTSSHNFTKELSNELFARETLRRLHESGTLEKYDIYIGKLSPGCYQYGNGYDSWMNMWYNIIELLPQEDIRKFQFQADESILYRNLCKNNSDSYNYNKACELIDTINNTNQYTNFGYLPEDVEKSIAEKTNYFYSLRGENMKTNIRNNLSFTNYFEDSSMQFILDILGKNNYLEYSWCMRANCRIQPKTYFSDSSTKDNIYLEFIGSGQDSDLGYKTLEANGDYNKIHTIVVDDQFQLQYSNYIMNEYTKTNNI